ncbi:hypothetical protein ABK040_001040 [Willaertia magna]
MSIHVFHQLVSTVKHFNIVSEANKSIPIFLFEKDKEEKKEPCKLTLITPSTMDISTWQLFCQNELIPKKNYSYDLENHTLKIMHNNLQAQFQTDSLLLKGKGQIKVNEQIFAAVMELSPVTYICDVSANAGVYVSYETGDYKIKWDVNSDKWRNATWENGRYIFTYGLTDIPLVGQTDYVKTFNVIDAKLGSSWNPPDDSFTLTVLSNFSFNFSLASGNPPTTSNSNTNNDTIPSVFPYRMVDNFDGFAQHLTGAMSIVDKPIAERGVLGIRGHVQNPNIYGFYQMKQQQLTNRLFITNDFLTVDGKKAEKMVKEGSVINYEGLKDVEGFPSSGSLEFNECGSIVKIVGLNVEGERMNI